MSNKDSFSPKFGSGNSGAKQQEPTTQVQTTASASITASAAATLELLKNPLEGVARGENQGMSTSGAELPGYYSHHATHIKRPNGQKPFMGSRLGGRYYFPLDQCTEADLVKLDALVTKELAFYVPDNAAK